MLFISLGQVVLLSTTLFQLTASLPPWGRNAYDLEEMMKSEIRQLSNRKYVDALVEARLSQTSGLERKRQLGDIEFSNRYAEYLRSKAKHSSMCAFLRRMQSVRKSDVAGDVEKVNMLLKQYVCPAVFSWPSDL